MAVLEVYDENDVQHIVYDAKGIQSSSHYGEEGSGYGYFRYNVERATGQDFQDIGYGYRVIYREYLNLVLFDGQIRIIEDESVGMERTRYQITALGQTIVFDDEELLRAYCDTRLQLWTVPSETASPPYHPDFFSAGTNEVGLFFHPNNDVFINAGDYTEAEYEFFPGEIAWRLRGEISNILGAGVIFDADIAQPPFTAKIDSVNDETKEAVYKEDTGEGTIVAGDTLTNTTRDQTVTISTIVTGSNTLAFSGDPDLSSWEADDTIELDSARLVYYNASIDTFLAVGRVLYNLTQDKSSVITAVDTVNDRITCGARANMSGWIADDAIFVAGPAFYGQITDVTGAVITYDEATQQGETIMATGYPIANLSKKGLALIAAAGINTSNNTITVTDGDHIEGWGEGDVIIQGTSRFYATISSRTNDGDGSGTITWNAGTAIGIRMVQDDIGWILYNRTLGTYATVDGWTTESNQVHVDTWSDISSWVVGNVIVIYTPLKITIRDSAGNIIWPTGDERQGAVPQNHTTIWAIKDSDGTTPKFTIRSTILVSGKYYDSSFALLTSLRVYSMVNNATAEVLMRDMVDLLSDTGHDLEDYYDDIAEVTKEIEPMVFEYNTPREALEWVCRFGDQNGNRVAWGVRLDARKRIFLEVQDLETISYRVRRLPSSSITVGGDANDSVQHVRGVYQDKTGKQQYTDWRGDTSGYFSGHFRRRHIQLDNVTDPTEAESLVDLYLEENKREKKRSGFKIDDGAVTNAYGLTIPVTELLATGKLVVFEDWRSTEAGRSSTDLRSTTVEQIVAVEIDHDAKTANLIPAGARSDFERYMAEIARMRTR